MKKIAINEYTVVPTAKFLVCQACDVQMERSPVVKTSNPPIYTYVCPECDVTHETRVSYPVLSNDIGQLVISRPIDNAKAMSIIYDEEVDMTAVVSHETIPRKTFFDLTMTEETGLIDEQEFHAKKVISLIPHHGELRVQESKTFGSFKLTEPLMIQELIDGDASIYLTTDERRLIIQDKTYNVSVPVKKGFVKELITNFLDSSSPGDEFEDNCETVADLLQQHEPVAYLTAVNAKNVLQAYVAFFINGDFYQYQICRQENHKP